MNHVETFPSETDLADALARRWLDHVAHPRPAAHYFAALSGGRIARTFFTAIARQSKSNPEILDPVHFFWADERCVPPTDPESNFRAAHELMLGPLAIPPHRVHRIRGEIDPPKAAAEASLDLAQTIPSENSPVLDIVFLGLGEDGHVASLFPGERPEATQSKEIYRAVTASKPPPSRITINYEIIARARNVWVLISGPDKEVALKQSLMPEGRTPLARVLKMRQHTLIFTDFPVRPDSSKSI